MFALLIKRNREALRCAVLLDIFYGPRGMYVYVCICTYLICHICFHSCYFHTIFGHGESRFVVGKIVGVFMISDDTYVKKKGITWVRLCHSLALFNLEEKIMISLL